jgi:hypothetical protein
MIKLDNFVSFPEQFDMGKFYVECGADKPESDLKTEG